MGNHGEQRRCMKLQVSLALTGSLCAQKLPLMLPNACGAQTIHCP
jgi:hypothetical protein